MSTKTIALIATSFFSCPPPSDVDDPSNGTGGLPAGQDPCEVMAERIGWSLVHSWHNWDETGDNVPSAPLGNDIVWTYDGSYVDGGLWTTAGGVSNINDISQITWPLAWSRLVVEADVNCPVSIPENARVFQYILAHDDGTGGAVPLINLGSAAPVVFNYDSAAGLSLVSNELSTDFCHFREVLWDVYSHTFLPVGHWGYEVGYAGWPDHLHSVTDEFFSGNVWEPLEGTCVVVPFDEADSTAG